MAKIKEHKKVEGLKRENYRKKLKKNPTKLTVK